MKEDNYYILFFIFLFFGMLVLMDGLYIACFLLLAAAISMRIKAARDYRKHNEMMHKYHKKNFAPFSKSAEIRSKRDNTKNTNE
jgi:hypothetical protein